jgi:hypothetical protein
MSTPIIKKSDRSPWFKLIWIVPIIVVVGAVIVFGAQAFRASDAGTSFLKTYPGHSELPSFAPVGFPAWLEWQHAESQPPGCSPCQSRSQEYSSVGTSSA